MGLVARETNHVVRVGIFRPNLRPLGSGEGLEVELITNGYTLEPPEYRKMKSYEKLWIGEQIHPCGRRMNGIVLFPKGIPVLRPL
jgi:hypothetical protein